jgi:NitT/TauT family transport system substrate-binding protein
MPHHPRTTGFLAFLMVAVLGLAAGCGSDSSGDDGKPDRVKVGVIAIVDVAPIYLGKEKGFFRKHGIELTLQPGSGGAATIPSVVNGQFTFGFGNVTSLMIARDKGLPVKVIASGDASTGVAGKDFSAVVVRQDSPIRSAKDLVGRTVAVNNLKNIGDTTVRASVRKDGGDAGKVRFLELPLPSMSAEVAAGRVDAAWLVEPFVTIARNQGHRVVAWNMVDTAPELTVATYFTSEKVIREDPDLVRRFTTAINESLTYAEAHQDEARKVVETYAKIPADVLPKMTLPKWPTTINRASVERLAVLAEQDGLVGKKPDLDALLPPTP